MNTLNLITSAKKSQLTAVTVYTDASEKKLIERHRIRMMVMLWLGILVIPFTIHSWVAGASWLIITLALAWCFRAPEESTLLQIKEGEIIGKLGKIKISTITQLFIVTHLDHHTDARGYKVALFASYENNVMQLTEAYCTPIEAELAKFCHMLGFTPAIHKHEHPPLAGAGARGH